MATTWDGVLLELKVALAAFVRGDATPYKEMWSTGPDVSIMGAFGGVVVGPRDVRDRLDRAAAMYRDGSYDSFEVIARVAGVDVGYLVWIERISSVGEDGSTVTRSRRATQVFRLEESDWRIVHQHSDPLMSAEAHLGQRAPDGDAPRHREA